jgi:hypothetical protein
MRRGIFTSWPRNMSLVVPNFEKPGQMLMFHSRRGYIWWMIRRPRSAGKHFLWLIKYLSLRLMIFIVRFVMLGRREREADKAVVAEFFEEHTRVSKAWSEARRRGDPKALKYEKELLDSIASREHWNAGEFFEMHKKWYDEVYQSPPK